MVLTTRSLLVLFLGLSLVGGSCKDRCGGGHQTLCRYFCEPTADQTQLADQSAWKDEKKTTFRSTEFREGVEGIFSLLDRLEAELSKEKAAEEAPSWKIVGGSEASRGQFPFIASLKIKYLNRYRHFCGGAAITTSFIVTAAHCVAAVRTDSLYVSIGDHDMRRKDRYERVIKAARVISHERFRPSNFENDIALIKLVSPFRLHNARQTIRRMSDPNMLQKLIKRRPNDAPELTVTGWGALYEGGSSAQVLNFVRLPYIEQNTCKRAMSPYQLFDGMLCAGDIEKGKIDACQGDSGGPIVYRKYRSGSLQQKPPAKVFGRNGTASQRTFLYDLGIEEEDYLSEDEDYNFDYSFEDPREVIIDHRYELAGLVSWGIGCAQPGYAGIYTNVAYYRRWIDDNMRRA